MKGHVMPICSLDGPTLFDITLCSIAGFDQLCKMVMNVLQFLLRLQLMKIALRNGSVVRKGRLNFYLIRAASFLEKSDDHKKYCEYRIQHFFL